jgi:hypothetical protein
VLADWEVARALHGDDASVDDLPRTEAQRRADAMTRIFADAASTPADANAPRFTHNNIKWDHQSFEKMLRGLDNQSRRPLDLDSVRETVNGTPIAPTEAILNALVHHFRRVMVDSAGTVIDLGIARRFTGSARLATQLAASRFTGSARLATQLAASRFTGSARLATQLAASRWRWPGCFIHTSRCQIDHTRAHSRGGSTNPGNGAPLCGWHNREKQRASRSGATPKATGTPTAPTTPKSPRTAAPDLDLGAEEQGCESGPCTVAGRDAISGTGSNMVGIRGVAR